MSFSRLVPASLTVISFVAVTAAAAPADAAQVRGAVVAGRAVAVPRVVPRPVFSARRVVVPYRPYYYPYGTALAFGVYAGYPYTYGYPYGYAGYGYGYPGYGYGYGAAYGGVRIQGAPRNAQVFADGYYVGVVNDFDGVFQRLTLPPGAHRVEIRAPGFSDMAFDVRIVPGQTINYHADGRP